MRLLWVHDIPDFKGGAYGYSVHQTNLKRALIDLGVEITADKNETVDYAIHICAAQQFNAIEGRRNILFTMTETDPPLSWGLAAYDADLIVVPCAYSRHVYKKLYRGPIEIDPEGVDAERFPFYERKEPSPDEPFRYLFVGADKDHRKGSQHLTRTFIDWLEAGDAPPNVQLYLKTSNTRIAAGLYHATLDSARKIALESLPDFFKRTIASGLWTDPAEARIENISGVIYDNRNLPLPELLEVYRSASAFVFPSLGEGWGLTLCESMSTGLPSIWSANTSMLDFGSPRIGYPVNELEEAPMAEGSFLTGLQPTAGALIRAMAHVYANYPEALAKGKAASERMRERYTWRQAAERFVEILENHKGDRTLTPAARCTERARKIFESFEENPLNA
jgi:glycosyltransferase involved in cell wall biosynthesis